MPLLFPSEKRDIGAGRSECARQGHATGKDCRDPRALAPSIAVTSSDILPMVLLSPSQTSWSLPEGMGLALLGTDLDGYSQLCVFWGESWDESQFGSSSGQLAAC